MNILEDQVSIPESKRKFPSPKNPHASAQLWHSQDKLARLEALRDPNWVPTGTAYNIYNQPHAVDQSAEGRERIGSGQQ
jgi:hypothetical protein